MKFRDLLSGSVQEIDEFVDVIEKDNSMILSIPHSSLLVPVDYEKNREWSLDILRDTDVKTDELYNFAFGTKIVGKCNPYFVNYSRSKHSFDEERGVFAWEFLDGSSILKSHYTDEEVSFILNTFYEPYHEAIANAIEKMKKEFGFALIVDCHSMARDPINKEGGDIRKDICFGTLKGSSVPTCVCETIRKVMNDSNYSYSFDNPYKGGFITQNYHNLEDNVFALQIEVVKENYVDNFKSYERNEGFEEMNKLLSRLISEIITVLRKKY